MDKDHFKFHSRTDCHERKCHTEKQGYVEAPSAEVKTSIRKSSRLQNQKKLSSCSRDVFRSYHSGPKYPIKSSLYKSKIQEGNKHQFPNRNEFNGVFSADTVSVKFSTVVPSFKYHVRAKEGIQLVVDFNMKQSDWLRSMEKEICVCKNHLKPEFESFRKEVEYIGDRENLKASSPDKTTASDNSLNSYLENKFSLNSMSRETEKTRPSVVEKEVITVSGSDRCWSKVDQNSDLGDENSKVQENCSHNTECLENIAFSPEEIQLSDFSSHQKDLLCSRSGKLFFGSVLTSTTEVNQEAVGNHGRSAVENGERTNSAEGMEVSGGEENVLVTFASNDGPKRRKCYHKSDNINGQSHERILRSTKLYGSQIIDSGGVLIRQSPRLLSKAVTLLEGFTGFKLLNFSDY